ncbi:hypothetical protein D3C71_277080 [compost metagenome]
MSDIQGYVIVHKETGERFGDCYDSIGGAKASWCHAFRSEWRVTAKLRHLVKTKFDAQSEFVIKPLVILESSK